MPWVLTLEILNTKTINAFGQFYTEFLTHKEKQKHKVCILCCGYLLKQTVGLLNFNFNAFAL